MSLPVSHLAEIVRNQSRHGPAGMFLEFACRAIEADDQPAPVLMKNADGSSGLILDHLVHLNLQP
jgi:hypothetical protein